MNVWQTNVPAAPLDEIALVFDDFLKIKAGDLTERQYPEDLPKRAYKDLQRGKHGVTVDARRLFDLNSERIQELGPLEEIASNPLRLIVTFWQQACSVHCTRNSPKCNS